MSAPGDAPLPIDISLLDGLEPAMTNEEQKYVTGLMTSGDPTKLAQAARYLAVVAVLTKQGVTPTQRTKDQAANLTKAMAETDYTNEVAVRKALLEGRNSIVRKIRVQEAEVNARKRLHPLPSRMPRQVTIDTFDPDGRHNKGKIIGAVGIPTVDVGPIKTPIGKGPLGRSAPPSLELVDDSWDGTVADAFAKITVDSHGKVVVKEAKDDAGIAHVLEASGDDRIADEPTPRVVIAEASNDAAKQGLRKGDVITHINGQELWGKSAEEVKSLLRDAHGYESNKFDIVVNAEVCVAEALRARAIC